MSKCLKIAEPLHEVTTMCSASIRASRCFVFPRTASRPSALSSYVRGTTLALLAVVSSAHAQQEDWQKGHQQIEDLNSAGRYSEALPVAQRNLKFAETSFGLNHLNTATSIMDLGEVEYFQGRYSQADLLFHRSLDIRENILGPNHPAVADVLDDLGAVDRQQGRFSEAEPLLRRAVQIVQNAPGATLRSQSAAMDGLAYLDALQGNFAESETLFRDVLARRPEATRSR
jgi:tetratricopeptide (TPR) repeat protein